MVRTAVADGRLTLVEGDERLAEVYAARFRRDLVPLTADLQLPAATTPADENAVARQQPGTVAGPESTMAVGVLSGATRRGAWVPGRTHRAVAFMGGAELDFRHAQLDVAGLAIGAIAVMGGIEIDLRGAAIGPAGIDIQAVAIMGGVEITVDPDTTVQENGIGIMGGFDDESGAPRRPDGPVVRISGLAFWGGVSITRKPPALERGDDQREIGR